ncbi:efflux transporter outer membrane subunit [soil metagenome]
MVFFMMRITFVKRSSLQRLLAGSASLVLLSACASFEGITTGAAPQDVQRYANSFPDGPVSSAGQTGQWPSSSWVSAIGGAPLQALVDEAMRENPGLVIAATRVAMARAMADTSAAASLPVANAGFDSTYQRFTENGIIPPQLAGQYQSNNQLALNVSYDVDFWGKHAAQLHSALSQEKIAEAQRYSAQLMLASAVARSWLQLGRQTAQLSVTSQQQQLQGNLQRLTQQRLAIGLDTETDLQQTRLQVALLQVEQTQWQEAIGLTRNQLSALLGQGPERGQRIVAPDLPELLTPVLPSQLPSGLLARRPDIVAARWQVEAAQGGIDAAKAQFYPNINLIGFAGLSSLGLSHLFNSGSSIVGIGPAIHLPLFASAQLRGQLKGNVASYDAAVATYNQSLTEALHEVADQVQSMRALDRLLLQHQSAAQAAQHAFTLAQQREKVGTVNRLQRDLAEAQWLEQCKRVLDAKARRIDVQLGLIRALGGGFDAATQGLDSDSLNNTSLRHSNTSEATQPVPSTRASLSESAS